MDKRSEMFTKETMKETQKERRDWKRDTGAKKKG